MIAFYILIIMMILAGMFVCGMVTGYQRGLRAHECEPTVYVAPPPATRQLELALDRIRIDDDLIAMLSTVQVVAASPYTLSALPWQRVPSPARTFWVQQILDDLQDVRAELAETKQALAHMDWVRARHWKALKKLRAKVAVMVPAVIADEKADQFTRSLTVAKSAFGRASHLSTAITELEIARFASASLDEFNAEADQILASHSLIGIP